MRETQGGLLDFSRFWVDRAKINSVFNLIYHCVLGFIYFLLAYGNCKKGEIVIFLYMHIMYFRQIFPLYYSPILYPHL
jgi:hypothetical protein